MSALEAEFMSSLSAPFGLAQPDSSFNLVRLAIKRSRIYRKTIDTLERSFGLKTKLCPSEAYQKMHIYDKICKRILDQKFSTEALKWITNQDRGCRCIWEFAPSESQEIINEIYSCGPVKVEVLGSQADIDDHGSIDMVLIYLPHDKSSRAMLFEIERRLAEETGFDASVDEGQRFILIRWT